MSDKIKHGPVQGVHGAEQGGHVSVMDYDGMGCGFEGEGGTYMAGPKELFGAEGNGKPIQRVVDVHRKVAGGGVTQDEVDAAKKAADRIDALVTEARALALNWTAYETEEKGYLMQWYRAAKAYYDDSDELPSLFHAKFGYAIETLACRQLNATLEGLTVSMQVGVGDTRPDIILTNLGGKDVAWLDITSSGDKGHIFRKGTNGWVSKPYVAEILYKPLDPKEVLSSMNNPIMNNHGKFKNKQQDIRNQVRERNKEDIKVKVEEFQQRMDYTDTSGTQTQKMRATKDFLKDEIKMDLGRGQDKNVKGGLDYLGVNSNHFGFKKLSSSQHQMVNHINQVSQPDIDVKMNALLDQEVQEKQEQLRYQSFQPEVSAFQQQSLGFKDKSKEEKEETVKTGIAAATAVELEGKLRSMGLRLQQYRNKGIRGAQQGMFEVQTLLFQKPTQYKLQLFVDWAQQANALLAKGQKFLDDNWMQFNTYVDTMGHEVMDID